MESSSLCRSFQDSIMPTPGYDFQEGQGSGCGALFVSPSSVMVGTAITGNSANRLSRSAFFGSASARARRQR